MLKILVAVILHHKQIAGATSVFLQRLTENLTILSRPGDFFKSCLSTPGETSTLPAEAANLGSVKTATFASILTPCRQSVAD